MPTIKAGKFALWGQQIGIINTVLEDEHVEFHPVEQDGSTRMRLIEFEDGTNKVETDNYRIAFSEIQVLEPNDSRIPESRRASE